MTLSPEVLSGLRERLEPCPFCGGAVELTSSKTLGDRLFCIKCPDDSPCVGSGLGIYVVAGQVETAIAAVTRDELGEIIVAVLSTMGGKP